MIETGRVFRVRSRLVKTFGLYSMVPELAAEAVEYTIAQWEMEDEPPFPGDCDTDIFSQWESW